MSGTPPGESWLQTSKLRMHYRDWASQGQSSGTVMVLHGLASSCHWYDLVIPLLVDRYRCVAPDQRGHGRTDQPSTGYDWHTVATDVLELMNHAGVERAAVMGHSWGANVALSLAAEYPERVSKLAMIDGGYSDWKLWPGMDSESSFRERLKPRDVSGTRQEFLDRLREQLAECWSDQLEQIVMSMVRVGANGLVRDILEPTNHAQVMDAMWNEPSSTFFPRVRCPTLIVAAGPRSGRATSEFALRREVMVAAAQEAIEDCKVEWIPDTFHDIGYHKPRELAQTLGAFLAE